MHSASCVLFLLNVSIGQDPPASNLVAINIIIFCAAYVASFACSWGPIPWVLCAEIYPTRHRGKAMSLSTATNW